MAIKTKKITDLATLTNIPSESTYFIGCNGETTGKVKYGDILEDVSDIIENVVNTNVQNTLATMQVSVEEPKEVTPTTSTEDFNRIENFVNQLKRELSDVVASYKELNKKYTSHVLSNAEIILNLQTEVAAQAEKIAALEGFVKALQADGYLTLANIKKAAADACPVEVSAE